MSNQIIQIKDGEDNVFPSSNDSASGYCKMPDGTLIQWGKITFTNVPGNESVNQDVPLTVPFISQPFGTANVDSTVRPDSLTCNIRPYVTDFTRTRIYLRNGFQSTQESITVSWLCIGRWK